VVNRDIIVIGGSAGSLEAVTSIARALPGDLPAAVFVVIHIPASAPSALPAIIARVSLLGACAASNGTPIERGQIYAAPPGCHLLLAHGSMILTSGPKENGHRPAIDPLFRSAARVYGARVIGVVLSGSQNDGAAGLLSIRRAGGVTIVQSPESALYPSMPRSAIDLVGADHVFPPEEIAGLLVRLAEQPVDEPEVTDTMTDEKLEIREIEDEEVVAQEDRRRQPGIPSTQTCPECHGTLWEAQDTGLPKFRCRIGHSYTAEGLITHQAEQLEAALWTALRALEEHEALARRLAARATEFGHKHTAARFAEQAVDAEHHAAVIRSVLHESGEAAALIAEIETGSVPG
jgi:two-component system, chemotaxis family, protein-glutamate methylesterase/glutaminase